MADIEAQIAGSAPKLLLPPRRYQKNPYFKRGELPRLTMQILREAGEPLALRVIAARALAVKGITLPDRPAMKRTRTFLQKLFFDWQTKGRMTKFGCGRNAKRRIDFDVEV